MIAMVSRVALGLPLLLLIVLVGVVFLVFRGGRRGPGIRRRPRKRHLVTRIVCGTLGAGILITVAVCTFLDVGKIYDAPAVVDEPKVRVRTLPAPPVPKLRKNYPWMAVTKGGVLVHYVFVNALTETPVHVETFEVDLSRREKRSFTGKINVAGYSLSMSCNVLDVSWRRESSESGVPVLRVHGGTAFSWRGGGSGGSRSSSGWVKSEFFTTIGRGDLGSYNPLSMVRKPHGLLNVIRLVSQVTEDDPMKEITVSEFAEANAEALARLSHPERIRGRAVNAWGSSTGRFIPQRGFAMIERFGPVCLLILVAAILFTQLFTRRTLVFAAVLAVMILYVAALDRMVLGEHLSVLADEKAPVEKRLAGCASAATTFFYRETAAEAFDKTLADERTPERLAEALKRLGAEPPEKTD